jgi:hypothetical protein
VTEEFDPGPFFAELKARWSDENGRIVYRCDAWPSNGFLDELERLANADMYTMSQPGVRGEVGFEITLTPFAPERLPPVAERAAEVYAELRRPDNLHQECYLTPTGQRTADEADYYERLTTEVRRLAQADGFDIWVENVGGGEIYCYHLLDEQATLGSS